MALVDKVIKAYPKDSGGDISSPEITRMIYNSDIKPLTALVINHLRNEKAIWLLFDNIDKGWTIKGASEADISIVKSLLEAANNLKNQFSKKNIDFKSIKKD